MRLVFHPEVFSDIDRIMKHYEEIAGRDLADDFHAEARRGFAEAVARPKSSAIRERDLRRVNLPYHFLVRVVGEDVRVLVVRHHRRHPAVGTKRQ
jgi:plasmid stabilization system protein ParE